MIYYLFLPLFLLLLIVLQNILSNILFFGIIGVEISLILVIYVGFRLDVIRGGMISFLLGFFLDCVTGSISGYHAFIYVLIFIVSMIASSRISLDKVSLIMIFTAICAIFKTVIISVLYPLIYAIDISSQILRVYLPQTLVVVLISPVFFHMFYRIEASLNGGNAKQFERS